MTPRVSVVMPARNAAPTIGAAIGSVLSQTFDDLELVVVDDGSDDETAAIAGAHPAPVRIVAQEHAGVAAARNRGLEEARGELIAFCDADDVLLPRHLVELVRLWDRHGGIVTGNAYLLFPGGIHPRKLRFRRGFPAAERQRRAMLEQNLVSIMSVFPRALVDEVGPFREELRSAEDWDFWLRAVFAGHRVTLQPRPLALLRWTTGLSADSEQMDADVDAVLRHALATLPLDADERAYVELRLAEPGPLAEELHVRLFELPFVRRSPLGAARAARALRRTLRTWSPDVVHAHNPGMAVVIGLAAPRARGLVTMHGVPDDDYSAAARALRLARLPVVACGPGVAAALAEHRVGVRATVVNGVTPAPEPNRQELERLAGSSGPIVVNVGRLVPQKNQRLAVRAIALVPDATLVVVGAGPLRDELEREAGTARLVFAGEREDARRLLGAADALVLTSHWEGLPLVVLEALAAGVPVVATAVRGVAELLDDGVTACLARPDDAEDVAAALSRVLGDPELATSLADAGHALADAYSEREMTRRYLELYAQL